MGNKKKEKFVLKAKTVNIKQNNTKQDVGKKTKVR